MKHYLIKLTILLLLCLLCLASVTLVITSSDKHAQAAGASLYDPGAGKTLQLIGQDYAQDFQDYVTATNRPPAGASAYGDIYSGTLNSNSQALVNYVAQNYPNSYVEVGLSWKDDLANHGYTGYAGGYHLELDVVNHKFDGQIDTFAAYLRNHSTLKFLLRLDYEVSLNIHANTNPNQLDPSSYDPQAYKDAFNYIAARIRGTDGASNVAFVYHPVRGITDAEQLYPGNQYVDWVGVSVFNNDVCLDDNGTDNCSGQRIDPNLAQVLEFARSQGKPTMISESAVQNPMDDSVSTFEDYLSRIFDMINNNDIRAFAYINYNWTAHGWTGGFANTDSRVQRDPQVLNYWLQTTASSRYIQYTGSSGGGGGGITPTPTSGSGGGNGINIPGNLATNVGAVSNGQVLNYTVNASASGAYYIRVTASSSQQSRLLGFSVDSNAIGNAAFGPGSATIGPPDFNLSGGTHTISVSILSDSISIANVDVYKR